MILMKECVYGDGLAPAEANWPSARLTSTMWEASSSLTRLAVLVLLTGSFAAVWSNDRHVQAEYTLARRENWSRTENFVNRTAVIKRISLPGDVPSEVVADHSRIVEPTGGKISPIVTADSAVMIPECQ